jgi:hypothetical protein
VADSDLPLMAWSVAARSFGTLRLLIENCGHRWLRAWRRSVPRTQRVLVLGNGAMMVTERHEQVWVGIDAGKAHHWAVGVNASGEKVFSRKVVNGEDEILSLMVAACEMADEPELSPTRSPAGANSSRRSGAATSR